MESSLQSKSWTEPSSRRSPGGIFLQLKSGAEPGSRRSPGGAYQRLKLVTELLTVEVVDGARLP